MESAGKDDNEWVGEWVASCLLPEEEEERYMETHVTLRRWNMIPIMRLTKTVSTICYRHPISGIDWDILKEALPFVSVCPDSFKDTEWHRTGGGGTDDVSQRMRLNGCGVCIGWLMMVTCPDVIRIKSSVDRAPTSSCTCHVIKRLLRDISEKEQRKGIPGSGMRWQWTEIKDMRKCDADKRE